MTPPSCTGVGSTFYASYALWLLLLLFLIVCLLVPALVDAVRARRADPSLSIKAALVAAPRLSVCLRDVLILVLLVHPALSGRTLELFRCQTVTMPGRGEVGFLMADYGTECFTAGWWGQTALHIFVLVFFTVGVIAGITVALFRRRDSLQEDSTKQYFGMLYVIYKPDRYFYEPINMTFKVELHSQE